MRFALALMCLLAAGEAIDPYTLAAFQGFGAVGPFAKTKKKKIVVTEVPDLQLSCTASFGPNGRCHNCGEGVHAAIAANIVESTDSHKGAFAFPFLSHGISHLGGYGSPFDFTGGFGGNLGSSRSLEANIEVFDNTGYGVPETVSIIATERAFVGYACHKENFGKGLSPSGGRGNGFGSVGGIHGGVAGYGSYGYGGYGGYNGYGYGGVLNPAVAGVGLGAAVPLGFAGPHQIHGKASGGERVPDGLLAEVTIQSGVTQVISLDKLDGFTDLKQLAGRGLIVCTKHKTAYDGSAMCEGDILVCCEINYDNEPRAINRGPVGPK